MAKTRKVRYERVAILGIAILVVIALIGFFISLLFRNGDKPVDPVKPDEPVNEKSALTMTPIEYSVYEDEEGKLGFNFLITTIRFEDEKTLDLTLNDLKTSEGIVLSDYEKYVKKLNENSYDLKVKGVAYTIENTSKDTIATLFVPFTKNFDQITLTDTKSGVMIRFNTKENVSQLKELKAIEVDPKEDGTDIRDKTGEYDIHVSGSFISTMMMKDGSDYSFPSSSNIYTFKLKVNSANKGVSITDAQFVSSAKGTVYSALDSSYESMKEDNILGKDLSEVNSSAALFFEVENSGNVDYSGTLRLKFSDSSEWVEISTELR